MMFFLPTAILGMIYWLAFSTGQVLILVNGKQPRCRRVVLTSLAYWTVIAGLVLLSRLDDTLFAFFGFPVLFPVQVLIALLESVTQRA